MERDFNKFYVGNKKNLFIFYMIMCIILAVILKESSFILIPFVVYNLNAINKLHEETKDNDRLYK